MYIVCNDLYVNIYMTIIHFDKIRDFTLQDYIRKCEIISDLIVFIHKILIFCVRWRKTWWLERSWTHLGSRSAGTPGHQVRPPSLMIQR